jgi:hypothetical protein
MINKLANANTDLKWKDRRDIPGKWNLKQAGIAILISNKAGFKTKLVRRDKEGHFILIKGTIQQEDITIVNTYVPNVSASNFIKQTLLDVILHVNLIAHISNGTSAL